MVCIAEKSIFPPRIDVQPTSVSPLNSNAIMATAIDEAILFVMLIGDGLRLDWRTRLQIDEVACGRFAIAEYALSRRRQVPVYASRHSNHGVELVRFVVKTSD